MQHHTFATQERTTAPSQSLRGMAGPCATAKGISAKPSTRGLRARLDSRYPLARAAFGGQDWSVDFGSLVEGGPV